MKSNAKTKQATQRQLGVAFRQLCEKRGWTQQEIVMRTRWYQSRVSELWAGRASWRFDTIVTVARLFDMTPSEFVKEAGF